MPLFALAALLWMCSPLQAQQVKGLQVSEPGYMQIINTKDGGTIVGRITAIEAGTVYVDTRYGQSEIPVQAVKKVKKVSAAVVGKYGYPDFNATRLFITTTAEMLEQGQGYYSNRYLFFSMIAYGITDRFTFGAGALTLPISEPPFYITPKVGLINKESLDLALGALVMRVPGSDDSDGLSTGILYGVGTFGGSDGLTAGLGWGFTDGEVANKPAVVLGGKKRFTRRLGGVVESWFFPGAYDEPFIIYGVRFLGMLMTVDVGMIAVPSADITFPGFPYLDFVFNFGQ